MKMRIEVIDGPEKGKSFDFDRPDSFLVGRSPRAHFVLDPRSDRKISRTHCLFDFRPPECILQDLESRNGTFVNGRRIRRAELRNGDRVRIGRTTFQIFLEQAGQAPETGSGQRPSLPGNRRKPTVSIPEKPVKESPLSFACFGCGRDLSRRADRDGLARELPDSLYLCPRCAKGEFTGVSSGTKIGDYRIIREIGRGGMGVVYKAVHEITFRLVALKRILPESAQDERSLKLFDREMAVQSMLVHPNLVRIIERGQHEDSYFFTSEYLAGGDAHHLLSQEFHGSLPVNLALKIATGILAGLEVLHENGYVHRDLKPANFLLSRPYTDENWVAKITDYGLAKSFEEAGNSLFDFTRMGEIAGSMMFMPPEQILEYRFVKPTADVYAVGASLYYLLTGSYTVDFSFGRTGPGEKIRNPVEIILDDPPIPILERKADLDPGLASVIDKAVLKDLERRFQTAAELRSELEKWL